jgi:hypothetical protein
MRIRIRKKTGEVVQKVLVFDPALETLESLIAKIKIKLDAS